MSPVGFGLEKIGYGAIRRPWLTLAVLVLVSLVCGIGFLRLDIDSQLNNMFRTDTRDFATYQDMLDKFPGSGGDVFIVFEGRALLKRENLEAMRNLQLDIELVNGVSGVLSMFSARTPTAGEDIPPPVFPDPLPDGATLGDVIAAAHANPLIKGRLLSDNGVAALMVVSLERASLDTQFHDSIAKIRTMARQAMAGRGVQPRLTGVPVMRHEIDEAIRRDRILYNVGGFVIGCLVSFLFFRSFAMVVIGSAAPAAGVLWSFGIFGWLGQDLNVLIVVVAPLIMVIAFSDAMHLLFGIRRGVDDGLDVKQAITRAIGSIGPACVLTSMTTALALVTLAFSHSPPIQAFGIHAAAAAIIAFLAVITLVPALALVMLPTIGGGRTLKVTPPLIVKLYALCAFLARWVVRHSLPLTLAGIVLLGLTTAAHISLEPRYRLSDYVPDKQDARRGIKRIDNYFGGSQALHIMVTWAGDRKATDPDVRKVTRAAQKIFEDAPEVQNVVSLETMISELEGGGVTTPDRLEDLIARVPEHIISRLYSSENHASRITGWIRDLKSEEGRKILRRLDPKIRKLARENPGFELVITGLTALSARQTSPMIRDMERSLFFAVLMVVGLIAIAFRSLRYAVLSVLPNILPIVAAGAALYITDSGLQLASCIAMTVAFGLAVDDTIHVLHRYQTQRLRGDRATAVEDTVRLIGPVLILTTVVLVLGVGVTLFSAVPSNRLFGMLCGVILVAALAADVFILPSMMIQLEKLGARISARLARQKS